MISIDQALTLYQHALTASPLETVPLDHARGRVLARDLRSQLDLPPMRQSAMDGYALRAADIAKAHPDNTMVLPLAMAIAAGSQPDALPPGHCARIFTGAPLPAGADTVEIQEHVLAQNEEVHFSSACAPGQNVRQQGEEISAHQRVLQGAKRLDAHSISLAAATGHAYLPCHRALRTAVIVTGDELIAPGRTREPAQIYESNGQFLRHFLAAEFAPAQSIMHCRDNVDALTEHVSSALASHDVILISGGASVGDHDYSRAAARACGVREVFWKVAQKPGKPLSFGIGPQGQTVFILPGNPASVHACAFVHVRAALRILSGLPLPNTVQGVLSADVPADAKRERLLRATLILDNAQVQFRPLPHQASHMLSNLPDTQVMVRIPAGPALKAGTRVNGWLTTP